MIDGRVCKVVEVTRRGGSTIDAVVVVGSNKVGATGKSRPGPDFVPDPAAGPNRWVKYKNITKTMTVDLSQYSDAWPLTDDFDREPYLEVYADVLKAAAEVSSVKFRAVVPEVEQSQMNARLEHLGVPFLTKTAHVSLIHNVWEKLKPKRRNPPGTAAHAPGGRQLTPPPEEKSPAEIPAQTESTTSELDELKALAVANGWDPGYFTGAGKSVRGVAGYTMNYMAKNVFDLRKHVQPIVPTPGATQVEEG